MVQISKISGLVVSILLLVWFLFNASWSVSTAETQQLKTFSNQTRIVLSDIPKPKGGDTMNKVVRIRLKSDMVERAFVEFDLPKDMTVYYSADGLGNKKSSAKELAMHLASEKNNFRIQTLTFDYGSFKGGAEKYASIVSGESSDKGQTKVPRWRMTFQALYALSNSLEFVAAYKTLSKDERKWVQIYPEFRLQDGLGQEQGKNKDTQRYHALTKFNGVLHQMFSAYWPRHKMSTLPRKSYVIKVGHDSAGAGHYSVMTCVKQHNHIKYVSRLTLIKRAFYIETSHIPKENIKSCSDIFTLGIAEQMTSEINGVISQYLVRR